MRELDNFDRALLALILMEASKAADEPDWIVGLAVLLWLMFAWAGARDAWRGRNGDGEA